MKTIDLIKEESKILINSLGVATTRKTEEEVIATEINGEVIRKTRIKREESRTVENDRIFITQTIKIMVVQLPHRVSIE